MIDLKSHIRTVSGFPIPGIEFRDITSLLEDPSAFADVMMSLSSCINPWSPTRLVGIESRGFIFGAPLAWDCNIPFILARKPGKLPNDTFKKEYTLEYGKATIEIQKNTAMDKTDRIVIVDDLIATGGTALACANLIHESFSVPKENILIVAVIELPHLKGSELISEHGYKVNTLIEFEGK